MKASDAVAKILAENDVTHGFELIGGMITHLVDSINEYGKTKLVSVHHEQAAAFAAGGVARATNHKKLGVALGTSGPGATNLMTGIADCWLDAHPCIFITGQVNTHELKGTLPIRQQGFQELDSVSLAKSITKYAKQITDPLELPSELQKAIEIAKEGRPGPVLLDIPMDIQRAHLPEQLVLEVLKGKILSSFNEDKASEKKLVELIDKINESKRPLFLIGGGAVNDNNFYKFLNKALVVDKIPCVSSLKGSEKVLSSELYFGMIGAYGNRIANYAIQNCDLLIVLGSRLDVRQTGAETSSFAKKAEIYQIDIEQGQLNNRVKVNPVLANVSLFYEQYIKEELGSNCAKWNEELIEKNKIFTKDEYTELSISPFFVFNKINETFCNIPVHYVADVGNNQMWAAHSLRLSKNQVCHQSGGLGAMGFSIPTAIGVQYATGLPVISLTGDGGAQLNIQELDIISREQLPILVIVFNNYSLGMVRGFQELYFAGRNSSTYWGGYSCDFLKIAEGYGLIGKRVDSINDFVEELKYFKANKKPMLIELVMSDARECRPRLEYGNSLDNQTPRFE